MSCSEEKTRRRNFFADDEVCKALNPSWRADDLLKQSGLFNLKDVVKVLELNATQIYRLAKNLTNKGKDPYQIMGLCKLWTRWFVRMKVFAPYYRKHLIPKIRRVDPSWDANTLLSQKGLFRLSHVTRCIPFSPQQIRNQAGKQTDARQTMGVWKDRALHAFIVDMEPFSRYIRDLWLHQFR